MKASVRASQVANILLAAVAVVRSESLHEPLFGCWDDQFNGTASTYLLISESSIVVSHTGYPPPLTFSILSNYTSSLADTNSDRVGVSLIASNDPNDAHSPGLFSDFDMMIDGNELHYCQIDFSDPSAAEAAKEDEEIDYLDLEKGCNGYPWSALSRVDISECKDLTSDQKPASVLSEDGADEGDASEENLDEPSSAMAAAAGMPIFLGIALIGSSASMML